MDVGTAFPLAVSTALIPAVVVGISDHFPTLYPEHTPFVIAPMDAFLADLAYTGGTRDWPNEAWLSVDADRLAADAAALRADKGRVNHVWTRAELQAATQADPEQLGLQSNLLIGFLRLVLRGRSLMGSSG